MNNIFKIGLICSLLAVGGVFLIISPFSKKEQMVITDIKIPDSQYILSPSSEPIPDITSRGVTENIDTIKSYTDLVTDILQKIFGTITSGLGILLIIKQLKDKKKKT